MPMILGGSGTITGMSAGGLPAGSVTSDTLHTSAIYLTAPAGAICFVCQSSAPTGWLKANGAAISRVTYSGLFAAIGTTFGSGDGSTTFNVPDMRGYFPRGWVDNGSVDSGRSFGSSQTDAMQGHKHESTSQMTYRLGYDGGIDWYSNYANANDANHSWLSSLMQAALVADGTNGTPRTATETRPSNIALLACIKF